MFNWLVQELADIKTRKFHLVEGPASAKLREAVGSTDLPLPPTYKSFVLQFGNSSLYRHITTYSDNYLVEVYAGPRESVSECGEALYQFGRTDLSLAYFKESQLAEGCECPIFEWRHGRGLQRTADGFVDWLTARCKSARKRFNKKEWEAVMHGPPPFTAQELAIVEARKHYRWRVVGIAPNGDLRFEIHNGSGMILPYISLAVRGELRPPKSGPLDGGAHLPVSSILPGETKIIEYDCYKQFVTPEVTEVSEMPDWGPEDREQFWELKSLQT